MDWQTIFTIAIVGALFFLMMRGCGRMAGGCGMGSRRCPDEGQDTNRGAPPRREGEKKPQ